MDYKIINDKKTQSWKEMLILLNDCNKHTYAPYDDITQKVERDIKSYEEKGQKINLDAFDSMFGRYNDIINNKATTSLTSCSTSHISLLPNIWKSPIRASLSSSSTTKVCCRKRLCLSMTRKRTSRSLSHWASTRIISAGRNW